VLEIKLLAAIVFKCERRYDVSFLAVFKKEDSEQKALRRTFLDALL